MRKPAYLPANVLAADPDCPIEVVYFPGGGTAVVGAFYQGYEGRSIIHLVAPTQEETDTIYENWTMTIDGVTPEGVTRTGFGAIGGIIPYWIRPPSALTGNPALVMVNGAQRCSFVLSGAGDI